MERVGCTLFDLCSGATDGGGENVGWGGLHNAMEKENATYVRRRGLEHISWNGCMAGLSVIGDFTKSYRGIISYLHQGGTWKRLQDIATTPVEDGGVGLMHEF